MQRVASQRRRSLARAPHVAIERPQPTGQLHLRQLLRYENSRDRAGGPGGGAGRAGAAFWGRSNTQPHDCQSVLRPTCPSLSLHAKAGRRPPPPAARSYGWERSLLKTVLPLVNAVISVVGRQGHAAPSAPPWRGWPGQACLRPRGVTGQCGDPRACPSRPGSDTATKHLQHAASQVAHLHCSCHRRYTPLMRWPTLPCPAFRQKLLRAKHPGHLCTNCVGGPTHPGPRHQPMLAPPCGTTTARHGEGPQGPPPVSPGGVPASVPFLGRRHVS
jgi:hypothetical protein